MAAIRVDGDAVSRTDSSVDGLTQEIVSSSPYSDYGYLGAVRPYGLMSDDFFGGQGNGGETTGSDIYECQAMVIRYEYEIARETISLYNIVGSCASRTCASADPRLHHLLGGVVNLDSDS